MHEPLEEEEELEELEEVDRCLLWWVLCLEFDLRRFRRDLLLRYSESLELELSEVGVWRRCLDPWPLVCPCDQVTPLSEPPCGSRLQRCGVSLKGGCKTGGLYEESELSESPWCLPLERGVRGVGGYGLGGVSSWLGGALKDPELSNSSCSPPPALAEGRERLASESGVCWLWGRE